MVNKLTESMIDSFLQGYGLDDKGNLKIISETHAKKAVKAVGKMVLETSRKHWAMLEAAEGSLANAMDEISFQELNADPSSLSIDNGSVASDPVDVGTGAADLGTPADAGMTLESLLGETDGFDFSNVFECNDDQMMTDSVGDEDSDAVDGDQDFQDMTIGQDDAGMGGDDLDGDMGDTDSLEGDDFGGDMDSDLGDEEDFGGDDLDMGGDDLDGDMGSDEEDFGGDEMAGDDLGSDLAMGDEDEDFDFDILNGGKDNVVA